MVFSENARIGGTLVWYHSICRRQVWLMSRRVAPDKDNDALALGRLIDQNTFAREKHQVAFGDNKFDFVSGKDGALIVSEVKKSSRAEKASALQLAHYLYELKKEGIDARGVLHFPTEKRKEDVILTDSLIAELEAVYADIGANASQQTPPAATQSKYCPKCAYAEYCWS
ncbi:CRISPR-associated protein Cas4 [Synergistales bacterium]|nr:CRISPR-associated protein Cas4 [Synergistales bacterium]